MDRESDTTFRDEHPPPLLADTCILALRLSPFATVSNLSSSEQQAMSRIIEQKQMKDFLKLYTGLVERCFESCCNDFTSKALSSKEVGCQPPCSCSAARTVC